MGKASSSVGGEEIRIEDEERDDFATGERVGEGAVVREP
jgi:hypothetical protein